MFKSEALLLLLITWLYQILGVAKGSQTLQTCPRVCEEKECQLCSPTNTYQLLPLTFFSFRSLEMEQKPAEAIPFQGSRWDQPSCGFLQTSQRWCWNASWTRMVFVHAHSLETTAGISCMNSADLSLVCLFCFLPSVSPVKGNYLRCSRPFCSKSRIICSPAERCFLRIFSEIANQK